MLPHDPEPLADVAGAELTVRPDLDRGRDLGPVGEVAGVVLHVHHEGVDFGAVGEPHQLVEALAAEGPGVDVDGAQLAGGRLSGGAGQRIGMSIRERRTGSRRRRGAGGSSSPQREVCWAAREATCRKTARTPSANETACGPLVSGERERRDTRRRPGASHPQIRGPGCAGLISTRRLAARPRGVLSGRERDGRAVAPRLDLLVADALGHQVGAHRFRLEVGEVLVFRGRCRRCRCAAPISARIAVSACRISAIESSGT